jgi:hypothetical protein
MVFIGYYKMGTITLELLQAFKFIGKLVKIIEFTSKWKLEKIKKSKYFLGIDI